MPTRGDVTFTVGLALVQVVSREIREVEALFLKRGLQNGDFSHLLPNGTLNTSSPCWLKQRRRIFALDDSFITLLATEVIVDSNLIIKSSNRTA